MPDRRDSGETPENLADRLLGLLLAQASDHALSLLDPEGRIVAWLAGSSSVMGYSAEEAVGRMVDVLFTPEDVAIGVPEHELRIAREVGKAEDDRWMLRKDGMRIWVTGISYALRDASGEVVGFGKIMRDVTDLKSRIDTTENQVVALTRAEERRHVFTGTLVHELGNTFHSLRLALQLMESSSPDERGELIQVMDRQIGLTSRLLDDLRDVAAAGQGKLRLRKSRLALGDALVQAVKVCRPRADERNQRLDLLNPPMDVLVDADPTRLNEIFVNLIGNAVKYTPDGGRIWVKLIVEPDQAVVKIEDTGVGIGPETLPRIFDLFTQEESSLDQSQGGLGIGLWLVKNLVALHGGTIAVKSEGRDQGSEFSVRLPLAQDA